MKRGGRWRRRRNQADGVDEVIVESDCHGEGGRAHGRHRWRGDGVLSDISWRGGAAERIS